MKSMHELTILVIDDDKETVKKIIADLRELGFKGDLLEANDGNQALQKLKGLDLTGKLPDMAICDIVMPGKTGVEFLRELREGKSSYAKMPVLMLTSQSDRVSVVACVKLGVNQYLIKPWDKKALMLKLVEIYNKMHD